MQKLSYSITPTKHGTKRMQQRGFKNEDIDIIAHYGTYVGDKVVFLKNKDVDNEIRDLKRLIKNLDRLRNRKIVVANSNLITCYPDNGKR